jgi:hypothetical protein
MAMALHIPTDHFTFEQIGGSKERGGTDAFEVNRASSPFKAARSFGKTF